MIKKSDNIFRVLILILMLMTCSKLLIAGNQHPTIRGIVNSAKYEKHGILILDRDSKNANIGFAPVPLIYYEQKYDLIIEDSEILVPVIIATKGDYIDFENCGISINSKINDLVTATLNLDQLACLEKKSEHTSD